MAVQYFFKPEVEGDINIFVWSLALTVGQYRSNLTLKVWPKIAPAVATAVNPPSPVISAEEAQEPLIHSPRHVVLASASADS